MTTTLSCQELGDKECDFVATGYDRDVAKRKMLEHAAREHFRKEEEGQQDDLSRRIDETLDARVRGPREDAAQGGEFLDDDLEEGDGRRGDIPGGANRRDGDRGPMDGAQSVENGGAPEDARRP